MELFFLFHLFSCTNKQSTAGFSGNGSHDMPLIYNLLSQTWMPKPGNSLIFLPKLFSCGHWHSCPGAVGSPSLEMFPSFSSLILETLPRLFCWSRVENFLSRVPSNLSHSESATWWFCGYQKFPYISPFNWIAYAATWHHGVSKNKQKKMKNMKRYKGSGKMIENSFCKVM